MGKALVLQNVNFSANKLDTVVIGEAVPCTGIELSQNTISFSSLVSETLTATLTPSNTTDHLEWSSSNDTVATVANGVVTAKGIGTATITATCGSQSATCSVSVAVELTNNDLEEAIHKISGQSASDFANGKDYIKPYGTDADTYKKYMILLSGMATTYKALTNADSEYDAMYPILIPQNTVHIVVHSTGLYSLSPIYMNSKEQPTYSITDKGTKVVAHGTNAVASSGTATFAVPNDVQGLDSVCLVLTYTGATDELPEGTTVSFSAS